MYHHYYYNPYMREEDSNQSEEYYVEEANMYEANEDERLFFPGLPSMGRPPGRPPGQRPPFGGPPSHGPGPGQGQGPGQGHGPGQGQGQAAGPPTTPPPSFIPPQTQQQQVGTFAVDPGSIRGCLFRFTYVWLSRGSQSQHFWFYPTFVGRRSISGWRWIGFMWVFFGVDLRQIDSFTCL